MDNYNLPPKSMILIMGDTNLHGFDIGPYITICRVIRTGPALFRYVLKDTNKLTRKVYLVEEDV